MIKKKSLSVFLCLVMMLSVFFADIPSVKATGTTTSTTPDFTIKREMNLPQYQEGDTGKITYTITPSGSVNSPVRPAADISLILDLSGSMAPWIDGGYYWVDGHYGKDKKGRSVWYDGYWTWVDGHYDYTKINGMKSAAKAFVQSIKSVNANSTKKDRISVIGFNIGVKTPTKAFTTDYDSVISYIDTLTAGGWTNYDDAMQKAQADLNGSTAKSKFAVLFSDGEPTHYHGYTSQYYADEYHAAKAALNTAKLMSKDLISLYTIGLGTGDKINIPLLQNIATAGGGKFYSANDASQLSDLFTSISTEIVSTQFSDIKIVDKMPDGFTIVDDPGRITINTADNTFETKIPNIVFTSGAGTPDPITVDVYVKMNKSGSFELANGKVVYSDLNGTPYQQKGIDHINVNVYAIDPPAAPTLTKNPTAPTNKSVIVTVNYPAGAIDKTYKNGINGTSYPYPEGGITVPENTTIYASYALVINTIKKQSLEGSIVVDNIDTIKPTVPSIKSDPESGTTTDKEVKITISYSDDSVTKEYRLNGSDPWLPYTGVITVTQNGTKIEARAKDAAGNYSEVAAYTVQNISLLTAIDFKFDGGKLQTSVMRNGTLSANLIFKTTGKGTPEFVLTYPETDEKSKAFIDSLVVKDGLTLKDSDGNIYDVKKVGYEISVKCQNEVNTNGKELTIKLLLPISKSAPYSSKGTFFKLKLKATGSELEVRVVRNPKLY